MTSQDTTQAGGWVERCQFLIGEVAEASWLAGEDHKGWEKHATRRNAAQARLDDEISNFAAEADATVARLEAEVERLKARADSLASANERLNKDAERYRWLRDSDGLPGPGGHPMADHPPRCVFGRFDTDRHVNRSITGKKLDAAIDAALAARSQEGA